MRVLLIRPNSMIKGVPMPIGLGYLSMALKKHGHKVSILDSRLLRLSLDQTVERGYAFEPNVVGLSVLNFDAPQAHLLAKRIKQKWPGIPVIMGGPYVSASAETILTDDSVDILVLGEGEETLPELIDALDKGRSIYDVRGLVYKKDNKPVHTERRPVTDDLDSYQIDWEALNPPAYFSFWRRTAQNTTQLSSRVAQIFTSRGCPFGCIFCHNIFGRKFRARSPENVIAEMEFLVGKYGIRELEISDDSFNLDMDRAKTISRLIMEHGLKIKLSFPNGLRADRIDEELLSLLKKAGTYRITYAVESASPRVQKLIGKALNLERTKEIISITSARGIATTGFFILGFPGETAEEMRMTMDYAVNSDLHIASFFYLCPFPGTPLAESRPDLANLVRHQHIEDYSKITINLSAVSNQVLHSICKRAYRRFYFQPRRILRTLKVVPKNIRTLVSIVDVLRLALRDAVNY